MSNNQILLKVDGMDCANCAQSITRFLERKGLENVSVNFQTKEVKYHQGEADITIDSVKEGIQRLGFIIEEDKHSKSWLTFERRLLICVIFTAPLLIGHILMMLGISIPFLEDPYVQLTLCLPVYILGGLFFGKSAFSSLRAGELHMDVLIFMGGTAAFIYSLIGTFTGEMDYIFYETSATILTLVLIGNWMEHRAIKQTTNSIRALTALQVEKARKIIAPGVIIDINKEDIVKGDLLQVNEGDKIPMDGMIISGEASIDESMITGESLPVEKAQGQYLVGGSLVLSGNMEMEVTAVGKDTLLGQMIELVKSAQDDKPPIQRLADKISGVFVPVVLTIALLTFLGGHWIFGVPIQDAMMNAIAVLVISCPCAMGLATPTAVMVGVGRMARNGILVKGGQTLEVLANAKKFIFDKTGTLTTGNFKIKEIKYFNDSPKRTDALILAIEQKSSHPIAQSLVKELKVRLNGMANNFNNLSITEKKGIGITAKDNEGHTFLIGSSKIVAEEERLEDFQVYLKQNDKLIAAISIEDELKKDAKKTIDYLKLNGVEPAILSGDLTAKTKEVAGHLNLKEFYAEKLPAEKLEIIDRLSKDSFTAMVGDGINDAPALAKATVGISLSDASQAAIQSAQIVLINGRLSSLKQAVGISKQTVITIRQNLFWAFAYNIVAIPIAAMGFLNPMLGALFMAFSDVIVIGNSIRLNFKKID